MANDIKSGLGYIIPSAGVVGFFVSLLLGEPIMSIVIAISGILVWFMYMLVMESRPPEPSQLGNLIILFGILLSIGVFLSFGVKQHLHGGYDFRVEGSLISLVILFFSILTGILFRNQIIGATSNYQKASSSLTDSDREWVKKALEKTESSNKAESEPKVIVVKQEAPAVVQKNDVENKKEASTIQSPYDMMQNPYYAYPPQDYYYGDEYEDDWEDEYEDE
tara:strand:+ start:556 stop:1218 length:663 start_codon:yes stop_codon:yes gene_type:complete